MASHVLRALAAIAELELVREPTPARAAGLQNLKRLKSEAASLAKELDAVKDIDPASIAKRQEEIKVCGTPPHLHPGCAPPTIRACFDRDLRYFFDRCVDECIAFRA